MRTWIKRTLFALFGVGLLAGGMAACGHRHHHHGSHASWSTEDVASWRAKLLDKAGQELQLDEAQKQRLGVLFDKMNEQRQALLGSTPDPHGAMAGLIAGASFDRSRALALIGEKTQAVATKSPEVVNAAADFFDQLKPEQQAKLREWMNKSRRHSRG